MNITRHDTGTVYLLLRERGDRTKLSTLREVFFGKLVSCFYFGLAEAICRCLSALQNALVDVATKADPALKGARRQKKTKQKQPSSDISQKASDKRLQTALVELQTMGFIKVLVCLDATCIVAHCSHSSPLTMDAA